MPNIVTKQVMMMRLIYKHACNLIRMRTNVASEKSRRLVIIELHHPVYCVKNMNTIIVSRLGINNMRSISLPSSFRPCDDFGFSVSILSCIICRYYCFSFVVPHVHIFLLPFLYFRLSLFLSLTFDFTKQKKR